MEKRKLSALPRPEATAEMVEMADRLDGMEHIVTAELVDDNKILLLNFYEVSKLKKGKTEAAFRTFLSSDDYITQDLSQSKVKWLTAAFDNMQGFRLWEYKWDQKTWKSEHIPKVFIWTAEDKSIMESFFNVFCSTPKSFANSCCVFPLCSRRNFKFSAKYKMSPPVGLELLVAPSKYCIGFPIRIWIRIRIGLRTHLLSLAVKCPQNVNKKLLSSTLPIAPPDCPCFRSVQ